MAKSILDQLLDLLTPEEQTAIKTKLAANPTLLAEDKFINSLFGAYQGLSGDPEPVTAPAAAPVTAASASAAAVHTPALPSAANPAASVAAAPVTSSDNKVLLDALTALSSKLDNSLKDVPTRSEIKTLGDTLFQNVLAASIKTADDMSTIRETNRREFGEELKQEDFKKFVEDNTDATTKRCKYPTLTEAYNAMVGDKRIAKKIADGVAEGVKQKLSGSTVTGQTQSTSLSPAQVVIAKAKKDAAGAEGKTHLQSAIDKLRSIDEGTGATVQ